MITSPRLSYNLQRKFSLRVSLFGYLCIFLAFVGVIVATLLTKARVGSSELHFLSNFSEPGFSCNSTAIYPGQQFGGIANNSSFTYVSQNSFAYADQTLGPCSVKPGYNMQVIGPPMAWPAITLNYTVTCEINAISNATFAATTLNHGTIGSPVANAVGAWNATVGAMETVNQFVCGDNAPIQAFLVDTATSVIMLFSQNSVNICNIDISDGNFTAVANLAHTYANLMEEDFTSPAVRLNPLPDLLYPCTKSEKVWAPTWTIVVECYTAVAATLGPALLIVTWILCRVLSVGHISEEEFARFSPGMVKSPGESDYLTAQPLSYGA